MQDGEQQQQGEIPYQPTQQAPVGQPGEGQPQVATEQQVPPSMPEPSPETDNEIVSWQASEFVDHQKSGGWIVLFFIASVILCAAAYLLMRSILSVVVIAVALTAFAVVAFQKPRTLTYSLLGTTLRIGERRFKYDDFRSFSVVRDGALWSVVLHPLKRFMPALTIYFAQEDGEKIFDTLASHLPQEEHQLDSVDRLMRKIRF